jgi:hypothetical protein
MAIARSEVRKDILGRPCEKCGELIPQDTDCILSFFRGSFIVLHEDCADFINTAQKGPRKVSTAS